MLERRPFFRRRGRTTVELLPVDGTIAVHREMSDAGRNWLNEAVPSLRREWDKFVEEAICRARR